MLTTDYDRTELLPDRVSRARRRSDRRGHRPGALGDLPAVRPAGGGRDGVAARHAHARWGGSSACPPTRSACATSPNATSRTSGCSAYPVLQTVDITIVEGRYVPVGEDQVSHLEISREIVRRFNRLYGEVLLEPQALLSSTPLIPGSDGRKMSKSLDNAVGLSDETRRDPGEGTLVHHRSAEGATRRPRPPGDLPDLRPAAPVLARGAPIASRSTAGAAPWAASTARRSWPTT